MAIKVRETHEEDFQTVRSVLHEVHLVGDWFTEDLFRKMLMRNHGLFFVAERDGAVVGTVFSSHDGGYFGYIYKIGVLPQFQREGIGGALLKRVILKFQETGVDWYFVNVSKANKASLKLLAKHGIRPYQGYLMADNYNWTQKSSFHLPILKNRVFCS